MCLCILLIEKISYSHSAMQMFLICAPVNVMGMYTMLAEVTSHGQVEQSRQ